MAKERVPSATRGVVRVVNRSVLALSRPEARSAAEEERRRESVVLISSFSLFFFCPFSSELTQKERRWPLILDLLEIEPLKVTEDEEDEEDRDLGEASSS